MIEKIRQALGNFELVFVCRTGSGLFCENCRDDDLIVVVKNWDKERDTLRVDDTCLFCFSEQQFEKFARLQLDERTNTFALSLLFADGSNLLYGSNPLPNYSWWDYRKDAVKNALAFGKKNFLNPRVLSVKGTCVRSAVWGWATYFLSINRGAFFTPEQKQILQKCHDGMLHISYRETLESNLKSVA